MRISRPHDRNRDASIQLSEIDIGMRQCLQSLWACEAVREKGLEQAKSHWMKVAERAWISFEDDRQFAQNSTDDAFM